MASPASAAALSLGLGLVLSLAVSSIPAVSGLTGGPACSAENLPPYGKLSDSCVDSYKRWCDDARSQEAAQAFLVLNARCLNPLEESSRTCSDGRRKVKLACETRVAGSRNATASRDLCTARLSAVAATDAKRSIQRSSFRCVPWACNDAKNIKVLEEHFASLYAKEFARQVSNVSMDLSCGTDDWVYALFLTAAFLPVTAVVLYSAISYRKHTSERF